MRRFPVARQTVGRNELRDKMMHEQAQLSDASAFTYKTAGNAELLLYVFSPAPQQRTGACPALVLFFGGGWKTGEPVQFVRHASYLASRGMVVVCADYRTYSKYGTSPFECVADAKSAVRWIRAQADKLGVDTHRVAAGGGSAGAHIAAGTAILNGIEEDGADTSTSCVPDALVLYNPVLDTTETGYGSRTIGERAHELSVQHHVQAGAPPTVIFHGLDDKTVPHANAVAFAERMSELGNHCRLFSYEGQGHGFYIKGEPIYFETVLQETDRFLTSLGWLQPATNGMETGTPAS